MERSANAIAEVVLRKKIVFVIKVVVFAHAYDCVRVLARLNCVRSEDTSVFLNSTPDKIGYTGAHS
jgi:hypothetical protein